jgi:methionine biosynthesis protein MetW
VILSQTLQAMRHTEEIVMEILRVGRQGIVSFPNFGYWPQRLQIMRGRMPVSDVLPYLWYDTPNVHLCTLTDFEQFCANHGVRILERIVMQGERRIRFAPNLRGSVAVYRFEKA